MPLVLDHILKVPEQPVGTCVYEKQFSCTPVVVHVASGPASAADALVCKAAQQQEQQ
jgi:hypothetical protein